MIALEVNGEPYQLFTDASMEIRMDSLCRRFSFSATRTGTLPFPLKGGESCRVLVDDQVALTGHIEKIDVNYSSTDHTIAVQGRDRTADLLDSSLGAISTFSSHPTLKQSVELVVKHLGLGLKVYDNVGEPQGKTTDLPAPEPGQNAFEFLEKLARMRQVFLTSDQYGNILITRATASALAPERLRNVVDRDDNNILSGSVSYDLTGRFYRYAVASALNPLTSAASSITPDQVANQSNTAIDAQVRVGRQLILAPKASASGSVNASRAAWEANVRKARSRVYSVVVDGFTVDGKLWSVNELVEVEDDFAGIHGRMLINSVEYRFNEAGSLTTLSMVNQNAYTLELSEPQEQSGGSFDFLNQ